MKNDTFFSKVSFFLFLVGIAFAATGGAVGATDTFFACLFFFIYVVARDSDYYNDYCDNNDVFHNKFS